MPLELCEDCKKMHYTTNPCAQIIAKRSTGTANSAGIRGAASGLPAPRLIPVVRDQGSGLSAPVDTSPKPKRGRPRLHEDRRAYKTAKQREYRSKLALNMGET